MVGNPQFVKEFRELYSESIKPLLEEGCYGAVHGLLSTPVQYLMHAGNAFELMRVHCGLGLGTQIKILYEETENGGTASQRTIRRLEAFMAQTKLPFIPDIPPKTPVDIPVNMHALLEKFFN